MNNRLRTALLIPTLNAGWHLHRLIPAIQALDPAPDTVLVIDSASTDDTIEQARAIGFQVHQIERTEFGHGRTRNLAASLVNAEILIFMTQDALPCNPWLVRKLLAAFTDPRVAHAFARQIPHEDANSSAQFARLFNYPPESYRRVLADVDNHGIRAFFTSNSCAAYRRSAFYEVGAFAENIPSNEDTVLLAQLLNAGYSSCYVASAVVAHSHNYTLSQEFTRYFDTGATHAMLPWFLKMASNVRGEGMRYLRGEIAFTIAKRKTTAVPSVLLHTGIKWLGYQCGRKHYWFPRFFKRRMSINHHILDSTLS